LSHLPTERDNRRAMNEPDQAALPAIVRHVKEIAGREAEGDKL
jgi:hypothetical protein